MDKDLANFLVRCLAIAAAAFIVVKWAGPSLVVAGGTAGGLLTGSQHLPADFAWMIPAAGGTLVVTGGLAVVVVSVYVTRVIRERPSDFATPLLGVFGGFLVDSAEIQPFDGFAGVVLGCITGLLLITSAALLRLPTWPSRLLGIAMGALPAAFLAICVLRTNRWSIVAVAHSISPATATSLLLLLVVTILAYLVSLFVDKRAPA